MALDLSAGSSFGTSAKVWSSERREFVSQKHMDFATVLADYNPEFSLVYIPESGRTADDLKPFAILHQPVNKPSYIIRYLTEQELDRPQEILAWLHMGDQRYHSSNEIIARMEAEEKFEQALKLSRQQEEIEDRIEEMTFLASGGRDRKHYIRHMGHTFTR
jgi:hypothetical protein